MGEYLVCWNIIKDFDYTVADREERNVLEVGDCGRWCRASDNDTSNIFTSVIVGER